MIEQISIVHSSILRTAVVSSSHVLSAPENMEAEVADQIAEKFLELGWVRQIKAVKDKPAWRRDATTGAAFALKLTRIGIIAIAALADDVGASAEMTISSAPNPEVEGPPSVEQPNLSHDADPNTPAGAADGERAPREGSKLDQVLTMLKAKEGATIEEIMVATNWLPHSARAVLTGLRKRGYPMSHSKGERGGASVYRVGCRVGGPSV